MSELGDAYHGVRIRVTELVTSVADDAVLQIASATPAWTVKDNVAHLAGITVDIVNGNLDGVGTDPWTAVQIDARRERTLTQIIAEWAEYGPVVEGMADTFGRAGSQLVADAATHEHDIRHALGRPGARDSDAVQIGFEFFSTALGNTLDATNADALLVEHDTGSTVVGDGSVSVTLRTTRFEFMRAVSGRRTAMEIAAYDWGGGAPPDGFVLSLFTARPDPLDE